MTRRKSNEERFWAKVDRRGPDDCWPWMGGRTRGYGDFSVPSETSGRWRHMRAHRFAYELLVGPIPEGLTIDHLCHTRECVNPSHLEPVTAAENIRRALPWNPNHLKTHCKWGHSLDPENTFTSVDKQSGRVKRNCKACVKRRNAERAARSSSSTPQPRTARSLG